jgi:hypothetical protein
VDGANDIFNTNLRLHKVTIGAKGFTPSTLIVAGKRGHHNNLYVFCFRSTTEDVKHVEPANFRHHHVADDEVRAFFNCHCERFFTVAC